jgi:hypothetical protein
VKQTKRQLIGRTKDSWQPRAARSLSDEDAREIAENVTGFFRVLLEWESREKEGTVREADDSYYAMSA